ncbi:hypothetical protein PIB30_106354 [Stylosanthes scabra]|uniref:Uncharacterized protein n=1 Tax=Stylosanthes scabra TaxID=79078 RepID=A0ABU6WX36_9FABA|nr:hypothetical protein [Stylosanthes scabra]
MIVGKGRKGRLRASRFLNYQDDGHVDGAVGLERKSLGVWWWMVWESQSETLQENDWAFGWLVWWWMVLGHGGWWWFASSVCVCVVVL